MRYTVVVACSLIGCLPKPQKDYTPDEIASIQSLEELMRVQAHHADPLFAKRERGSFSDEELAAMKRAAAILQATSVRVRSFAGQGDYDEAFAELASGLRAQAETLEKTAAASDTASARAALEGIRSACKACHSIYR
jgi:hypothetical protein